MPTLADNYRRRIAKGVQRLGTGLNLVGSVSVGITAIVLPTVVQIVSSSATALQVRQSSAQSNSLVLSDTAQPQTSSTASSSTSALPTIYLLQDALPTTSTPTVGQTFSFDGVTWTVQSIAFEYVQGERVAIVTTCTGPAVS